MVVGHKDSKGDFHPHTGSSGAVSESEFLKGDKDILGNPRKDKFSNSALPMSEKKAVARKVGSYVKGLNERVAAVHATGNAKKSEAKAAQQRRDAQADKNLEIAGKFLTNAELLRQGKSPTEEIKIEIENNAAHEKLPKNLTPEQVKERNAIAQKQQNQESKVIENIAKKSQTVEPDIPIMPSGPPQISYSSPQEEEPVENVEPSYNSRKSFDQQAIESFPVAG